VYTSDFREIADRTSKARPDRLLRAAVSSYCALPRPAKRETVQLEDLALPLLEIASVETRRFVAAVLSESDHSPAALVRRLCNEPVEIAAPLLVRSGVLTDIDLIALIGRHGLAHARAIGRRKNLNPAIARLIRALDRPAPYDGPSGGEGAEAEETNPRSKPLVEQKDEHAARPPVEAIRDRLRTMMEPAGYQPPHRARPVLDRGNERPAYAKLRDAALTGNPSLFHTTLADALGIGFRQAEAICGGVSGDDLIPAFRALDLQPEQALLICLALHPRRFGHAESVRLFVEHFRQCRLEEAREQLRACRTAAVADAVAMAPVPHDGSNCNRPAETRLGILRVS
jgi:uncharacterized protein (DUF2336 family)